MATEEKDTGQQETRLSAGTLRKFIQEEIAAVADKLTPGTGKKSTEDSDSGTVDSGQTDIKSQVSLALQQLRTREERQERDKRVDAMLAEHEKPKVEVTPAESRRVEKFMRWGD